MRVGVVVGAAGPGGTLDGIIESAQKMEAAGIQDIWMANIFGHDAISTLGFVGRETKSIGLGTAVTPTYPRHPSAIAQQAMTTAAAAPGRFSLGIGLSHKVVIEDMLGFSYDKPARHMREYLSVLGPLLKGETVNFDGDQYNVHNLTLGVPDAGDVPIIVAALGPVMLKLAGEMADGTITWMTGPNTLQDHIIPRIAKGASGAGKSDPTIVAGFPIALTSDVAGAKSLIAKSLEIYGQLPSYRAMLDKEGLEGPADLALVGDKAELKDRLAQLREIGVTHFNAAIVAADDKTHAETLEFLAAEA